ncbi:hypothetical protein, partial [Klebsiella variicola]|uniref:hypothetical protein n=1 Tax=Klebsiella variicola TaxID=244366 RepID=UPI0027322AF1
LASATAVTYDPGLNISGAKVDALTFRISDEAGANGATLWSAPSSISNVNESPAPSGFPTTVTATTNTPVAIALSALKFNDIDSP